MNKYIAIDDNKDNAQEMHLTSEDNQFTGTFKIKVDGDNDPQDINNVFAKKDDLLNKISQTDIDAINTNKPYTLEETVKKLNEVISIIGGVVGQTNLIPSDDQYILNGLMH